jgi:hypothetical protein
VARALESVSHPLSGIRVQLQHDPKAGVEQRYPIAVSERGELIDLMRQWVALSPSPQELLEPSLEAEGALCPAAVRAVGSKERQDKQAQGGE